MKLPNNSEAFKSMVTEKIKTYCDTNIWPFDYDQFSAWLNNFECEIEEYLMLQILDNLIVRSYEMSKASYSRLLHGAVRQYLSENTSINVGTIPEWRDNLSKGTLNNQLRITPVRLDEDGESGEGIYRKLSPEVNTVRYSLSKANNTPEVIIIVDDFIGSGKQFLEYADKFKLADQLSSTKIVYCPLIGFEIGISTIQSKYPQLKILPAEYIYESDSLFFGKDNEKFKNDQENTIAEVKNFLIKMRGKYTPRMTGWLGREEAGLALAFEWGCPNQVPALLYMDHSPKTCDWQQLFSRRS